MAVTFQGKRAATYAETSDFEIERPTEANVGDMLWAYLAIDTTNTGDPAAVVITPPAGWTLVSRVTAYAGAPGTPSVCTEVYRKVVGVSEATTYTFMFTGGDKPATGVILAYAGHLVGEPVNASGSAYSVAGSNLTANAVTTTREDCTLLRFYTTCADAATSWTVGAGATLRHTSDPGVGLLVGVVEELRGPDELTNVRVLTSDTAIVAGVATTVAFAAEPEIVAVYTDNYKAKLMRRFMHGIEPFDARFATVTGRLLSVIGTSDNEIGGLFGASDFLDNEKP